MLPIFTYRRDTKTPVSKNMNTIGKRIYRELDDATKEKISKSSQGKPKSASHKFHISQAMTKYWQGVPNKPQPTTQDDEEENTDE